MLSPNGYVSLSLLWKEFNDKHRAELVLEACHSYTQEEFLGHKPRDRIGALVSDRRREFGSPLDFIEEIFVKSLESFSFQLCSAKEKEFTLPTGFMDGSADLLLRMSVYETSCVYEELGRSRINEYREVGSMIFEALEDRNGRMTRWEEMYPKPANEAAAEQAMRSYRYHRLPMCFVRNRFTVCDPMPSWADDAIDEEFIHLLAREAKGLSICLRTDEAEEWRSNCLVGTQFRKYFICQTPRDTQVGRPSKVRPIVAFLAEQYPGGEYPSRKNIQQRLRVELGLHAHEKTVRRAIKALREGQNQGQN